VGSQVNGFIADLHLHSVSFQSCCLAMDLVSIARTHVHYTHIYSHAHTYTHITHLHTFSCSSHLLDECMTLWGEPERVYVQNVEQLHVCVTRM